jgi:hypothetical protein
MKQLSALLALSLALAGGTAQAEINTLDNVPAATLLLPHFAVDTNNAAGIRTVFTVGNSGAAEQAAHVTIWSDRGVPVFNFDVRLAPRDVVEVDLRELLVNGAIPTSTAGAVPNCGALLPPINLNPTQATGLRNALTGLGSSLLGGQCAGVAHGDGIARGYVTIDAVNSCSTLVPGDAGYFVAGGTGIASNANVLWGEQSTFNASTGVAYGDALVHIEADALAPETNGPPTLIFDNPDPMIPDTFLADYTFYARLQGAIPADNREGLPTVLKNRYAFSGAVTGTTALVWRDPGDVAPFACGNPPPALETRQIVAFDHQEDPTVVSPSPLPYASQAVDLGGSALIPYASGMLYYNLEVNTPHVDLGTRNQAHVSHVLTSSNSAAQISGVAMNSITGLTFVYPVDTIQCSDGVDNDNDGQTDFPADTSCANANSFSESTQCSNGVDDDGDMVIDFPADPGCSSLVDTFEDNGFVNACSDGIDNDGDGLADWPTDPGCAFPNDSSEFFGLCDDGIDNDMDGNTDFPADLGCTALNDNDETNPQCIDGISNDADGLIDFPADPGCQNANSNQEAPECDDAVDNDTDGDTDHPADAGCAFAYSTFEGVQCDDGIDNDGDGNIDFPADTTCASPTQTAENTSCSDGMDNDNDGLIDFPADLNCTSLQDTSEFGSECSDGADNDGDGNTDFPNSPGCSSAADPDEAPDCSDVVLQLPNPPVAIDNDFDGLANFGSDPGCASALDLNELAGSTTRECSDGIDNDADGFTDFGGDAQCTSAWDDVEYGTDQLQLAPTEPVPALSLWGLAFMASLVGLLGAFVARRGARHHG